MKTILHEPEKTCEKANRALFEIHALTGNTTAAKALKSIQNAECMSKVWKKIGHADKKKDKGSILSLQVPVSWPDHQSDTSGITMLDNPKKASHWKTVELPKDVAFYLNL
eukprot:555434-Ditylum_brightwellii.AAC.1